MTILQQREQRGIEKGHAQGFEQGLEQGLEQGKLKLLINLLDAKFEESATNWIDKLYSFPTCKIDIIAERILTKDSLEEIFEGMDDLDG